jgi:hypothetical protein
MKNIMIKFHLNAKNSILDFQVPTAAIFGDLLPTLINLLIQKHSKIVCHCYLYLWIKNN